MEQVILLDQRSPDVAQAISAVQRAAYAIEARLIGFDALPPLHESVEDVQLLELQMLGIIGEHGTLSAVMGYRRNRDGIDIDRLAVHPAWFRRGFARRLLEDLHGREHDASRFDVSTGAANAPTLALYESMGYVRTEDVELPEGVTITRLVRLAP